MSRLFTLRQEILKATKGFGAKADLARFLGVKPPQLSAWLSGKKEPGGEVTLTLQAWVQTKTGVCPVCQSEL